MKSQLRHQSLSRFVVGATMLVVAILAMSDGSRPQAVRAQAGDTETPTPTATLSDTPTATRTPSPVPTLTPTVTLTPTFQSTPTSAASSTPKPTYASPDTLVVNTTDDVDDGNCNATHCSLREAINTANANPNASAINFNISGTAPYNIKFTQAVPAITSPVEIDGTTQPGYSGIPIVQVSPGTTSVPNMSGITLWTGADGVTIRGLSITGFYRCMDITSSTNVVIEGNYIGLTPAGAAGSCTYGIDENTTSNILIGGTIPNVIVGTQTSLNLYQVTNATVIGNLIGTGPASTAFPASHYGVYIGSRSTVQLGGRTPVSRNVINGGGSYGVLVIGDEGSVVIEGNYIGTDATGTLPLGNGTGLAISAKSGNIQIGNIAPGSGNVISGNSQYGIYENATGSSTGFIMGNLIGIAADGVTPLGNGNYGVNVIGSRLPIGGISAGAGNRIAHNGAAGIFVPSSVTGLQVRGNSIFSNGGLGIDLAPVGVTANDTGDTDSGSNLLQNFPVLTSALNEGTDIKIQGTLNSGSNRSYSLDFFASPTCDASGNGEGQQFLGTSSVITNSSGNAAFTTTLTEIVTEGWAITATATDGGRNTSEFSGCIVTQAATPTTTPSIPTDTPIPPTSTSTLTPTSASPVIPPYLFTPTITFTPGPTPTQTDSPTPTSSSTPLAATETPSPTPTQGTGVTLVVNTADDHDDGLCSAADCSLREAIIAANADSDPDSITFNIPGDGPSTIRPLSSLPTITNPVILDAETQPGFTGSPIIELAGNLAGSADGLRTTASSGITIRGFAINQFSKYGIWLGGDNNVVQGNYIGTDLTGTYDLGNGKTGVEIWGTVNNLIGGTDLGNGNVISGNNEYGIEINGSNAPFPNNVIQGNLIGTNAAGTASVDTWAGTTIYAGIHVLGSYNNMIGGSLPGARNIISGNRGSGIYTGVAYNTRIQGNYIGTNINGTVALPNKTMGIRVDYTKAAVNTLIGGTAPGEGNLVIGNNSGGVAVYVNASQNTIQGNLIGTTADGSASLGASYKGLVVDGDQNVIGGTASGSGNTISGSAGVGFQLTGIGNVVQGNRIGTDLTGMYAVPNRGIGLNLAAASFPYSTSNNTIGGASTGAANIISGNYGSGISASPNGSGNVIAGNLIGTDITGLAMLANGGSGIEAGTGNLVVGGSAAGASNVISGNMLDGITITAASSSALMSIQGNKIGTNITGNGPLGNHGNGINFQSSYNASIGGVDPSLSNVIAFNQKNGVLIASSGTVNSVSLMANSIFGNGKLGFDLWDDGVTPNDYQDPDSGPNGLQNFPVISLATGDSTGTQITGTLNSIPSTTFTVRIFSNVTCDPSGYGEGQTYIGSATVITNSNGNGSFVYNGGPIASGLFITSTATVASGKTSEFSACVPITAITAPVIAPVAGAPDNVTTLASPVFNWTNVTAATQYVLSVDGPSGNVISQNIDAQGICDTSSCSVVSPVSLEFGQSYTWQVRAKNLAGVGPWSNTASFDVGPQAGPVSLIGPFGELMMFQPTFTWYPSTDTTQYLIKIIGPSGTIVNQTLTAAAACNSVCSFGPLSLNEGGNYSWMVESQNGYGDGPWSAPLDFSLNYYAAPDAPDITAPAGVIVDPNPLYVWNAAPGAKTYTLKLYGTQNLLQTKTVAASSCAESVCSATLNVLAANGDYRIEVTATNPYGTGPSDISEFTLAVQPPTAPSTIAPTGAVTNVRPLFRWTPVSGVKYYNVSVDNEFGNVRSLWYSAAPLCSPTECSAYLPLLSNGDYTWMVRAYSQYSGVGPWSTSMSFSVSSLPGGTAPISPSGTFSASPASFQWAAVNNVTRYLLSINDGTSDVTQWFNASDSCNATICSGSLDSSLPPGTYTWKIQTENSSGIGPWSTPLTFTIQPIIVNTTDDVDDGVCNATHCSLREAINAANVYPGIDTIAFNISGSGVHTIQPNPALPKITQPAILDGTTQPGFAGTPIIELDGTNAGNTANGITVTGGNSVIRGLVINRFKNFGISIETQGGNRVEGNYIGTDPTGNIALGIPRAVVVASSDNIIGGTTPEARNVISGNSASSKNWIGITIYSPVTANTNRNVVQGNYIGTNAAGTAALPNNIGISISLGYDNLVGGTTPEARNIISGNTEIGVSAGGTFTLVQGNFVGTDVTGTYAIGNGKGIGLGSQNVAGGTTPGARNIISGNTIGIGVGLTGTVQGNYIGTDVTGHYPIPNTQYGIHADTGSMIGGIDASAGNVIAFNGGPGIWHQYAFPPEILSNRFFDNDGLGIDNNPIGVNTSAASHPTLFAATSDGVSTTITGFVETIYGGPAYIQFFSNSSCDPTGYGEGESLIGAAEIATDINSQVGIVDVTLPVAVPIGHMVTATQTDRGNRRTSEFSNCAIVALSGAVPGTPANFHSTDQQATSISLAWDDTANETGFRVQRSLDGLTNWILVDSLDADVTSIEDDSVLCGTQYSYRIQAFNESGASAFSVPLSVSTQACPTPTATPTPTSNPTPTASPTATIPPTPTMEPPPAAPDSVYLTSQSPNSVTLTWDEISGAAEYRVERSLDELSSWILIGTVDAGATSHVDNTVLCETTYYYHVQAQNEFGTSEFSPTASISTAACLPPGPVLKKPAEGVALTKGAALSWVALKGSLGYQVQVDDNDDFSSPVIDTVVLKKSGFKLPLQNFGTYYWRVKTQRSDGVWTDWSEVWSLTFTALKSPKNGSATKYNKPALKWAKISGAVDYHLQISQSSDFSDTDAIVLDIFDLTKPSYKFLKTDAPLPSGVLYWRVQAEGGTLDNWTPTWSFTVP